VKEGQVSHQFSVEEDCEQTGGRWGDREVVEYGRTCTCRRFLLTEKQMSGIARDSPATRGF
jgi:hypothetical protein